MHILNIIILTHSSLLSSGLASKLNEYKESLAVKTLDFNGADFLNVLKKESPEIVILDSKDAEQGSKSTILQLLETAPGVKVISLDLASDQVRIFSSTKCKVNDTNDLVGLIQTSSGVHKL
ncbi:MAG TPA: hypothetical protein VLX61_12250 [Anaerolineales bacterium]|nr:hypothetical protein [Anaerolineales bacterium]